MKLCAKIYIKLLCFEPVQHFTKPVAVKSSNRVKQSIEQCNRFMKSEREEFVKECVWSRQRIEITHKILQGIIRSTL